MFSRRASVTGIMTTAATFRFAEDQSVEVQPTTGARYRKAVILSRIPTGPVPMYRVRLADGEIIYPLETVIRANHT